MLNQKYPAISGDGNSGRFALLLEPDGVYRVDGRVIPVCDKAAISNDHSKPVVVVHDADNCVVGLLGSQFSVNIEK